MYVSVIIPTYNRAGTIGRSIESVLAQTHDKLEVIIIDDGSTDNTEEIVSGITDDRLRYIKLESNGGVSKARNQGVNLAKYDMIAFQDSDDAWRPDKLEKQIRRYEESPDALMVYCAYELHIDNFSVIVPPTRCQSYILDGIIYPYLLEGNSVGAPTVLMEKDVFVGLGGFDVSYPALEDWKLALEVAKKGKISYIDEVLVDVFRCDSSIGSSLNNYYKARCKMIAEYMDDMLGFGIFDSVVSNVFRNAEDNEMLDYAKKLL
ncbi:MAG: glycosyltransferase, partial [Lachnospiraceae bacterium]|nr:glycosyltransferase [Lachnospiraceae bacterium]